MVRYQYKVIKSDNKTVGYSGLIFRRVMKEFLVLISSFLGVLIPQLIYHGYQYLILENCDSKFGCLGAFQFIAIIFSFIGGIIAFGVLMSYLILNKTKEIQLTGTLLFLYFLIGCLFSYLTVKVIGIQIPLFFAALLFLVIGFFIHIFLEWLQLKCNKSVKSE